MKKVWKIAAVVLVLCMVLSVGVFASGEATAEASSEMEAAAGNAVSIPVSAVITVAAFALFIFLCFKGTMQFVAIMVAVVITCFASGDGFFTAFFSTFTSGCATGIQNMLLLMLSGALFGCAMSASGCSDAMGRFLVNKLGAKNAPYVVMIDTILAALGGSPVYVFIVGAVSVAVMSKANLPMYIALAAMSGTGVLISFCMPGFAGLPNVLPTIYLGTDLYAGGLIGWVTLAVGLVLTFIYVTLLTRSAVKQGHGYEATSMFSADSIAEDRELPGFAASILPVAFIIILCYILQKVAGLDAMTSVVVSQFLATILIYVMNWKRIDDKMKPVVDTVSQTSDVLLCLIALTGYASVLASTPCYQAVLNWVTTLNMNPYVLTVIAVAIIVAISSDGNGGQIIFFTTVAPALLANPAVNVGVIHRLTTITATTFDSLPQNGSVYMNMRVFGYTHKNGYKYMFLTTVCMTSILAVIGLIIAVLCY